MATVISREALHCNVKTSQYYKGNLEVPNEQALCSSEGEKHFYEEEVEKKQREKKSTDKQTIPAITIKHLSAAG